MPSDSDLSTRVDAVYTIKQHSTAQPGFTALFSASVSTSSCTNFTSQRSSCTGHPESFTTLPCRTALYSPVVCFAVSALIQVISAHVSLHVIWWFYVMAESCNVGQI